VLLLGTKQNEGSIEIGSVEAQARVAPDSLEFGHDREAALRQFPGSPAHIHFVTGFVEFPDRLPLLRRLLREGIADLGRRRGDSAGVRGIERIASPFECGAPS